MQGGAPRHCEEWHPVIARNGTPSLQGMTPRHCERWHPVIARDGAPSLRGMAPRHCEEPATKQSTRAFAFPACGCHTGSQLAMTTKDSDYARQASSSALIFALSRFCPITQSLIILSPTSSSHSSLIFGFASRISFCSFAGHAATHCPL